MPHSGMPGASLRPGVAQHQHVVRPDIERFVVDGLHHVGIGIKDERPSLMDMELRIAGGRFQNRAVRRKIAPDHR